MCVTKNMLPCIEAHCYILEIMPATNVVLMPLVGT